MTQDAQTKVNTALAAMATICSIATTNLAKKQLEKTLQREMVAGVEGAFIEAQRISELINDVQRKLCITIGAASMMTDPVAFINSTMLSMKTIADMPDLPLDVRLKLKQVLQDGQ